MTGKRRIAPRILPGLALLALAAPAPGAAAGEGLLQATALVEYQTGRDPTAEPEDIVKLFRQVELDYGRDALRLGLRFEGYRNSLDDEPTPADFDEVTRRYAEWTAPGLRVRLGHGFVTLGRGLLLRAFELPGVVQTANFPPSRYVDNRDLDGLIVEARRGPLAVVALTGRPVTSPANPPGSDEPFLGRRSGTVSGGRVGLRPRDGLEVGATYLLTDEVASPDREEQGAVDLDLSLHRLLPALRGRDVRARFHLEYAGRGWRPLADGLDSRDGVPHALYTATEIGAGRWGLSFETKRYHRFALVVNDPPNLVPEFPQRLLNRGTHLLLPADEKGWQLSLQGALPRGWTLQTTLAKAANRRDVLGSFRDAQDYRLAMVGVESPALADWRGAVFAAAGKDEIEGIVDRRTIGARGERSLPGGWSLEAVLEHQRAERRLFADLQEYENLYAELGVTLAGRGTLALQAEFSNDPGEKDDVFTPETETDPRSWWGATASAVIDGLGEAVLFAGQRRGGTACTSGTCYEVPDFEGMELRLVVRY